MPSPHVVLVLLAMVLAVSAHPPATFTMLLDSSDGNPDGAVVGVPYNLSFLIYDMLNNFNIVNITQLVPFHQRYVHAMLASEDISYVYHIHPEDFSNYTQMAQNNNFFVTVSFPLTGRWYMAVAFMANISGVLREGSAQYEFIVGDYIQPGFPRYNFTNSDSFKTYPIGPDEKFDVPIFEASNELPGGYKVSVSFNGSQTHLQAYKCQPFYFTVTDPNGLPATNIIPFLDAPVHITLVAAFDTVYHAHGMDLPSIAPTYERVQYYAQMMGTMDPSMIDPEMNIVMMNAMMTGFNNMGIPNCTADLGPIMTKNMMSPYEPMLPTSNYTFGPNFMALFDFPNAGNWQMFLYLRLQIGNETKLFVPSFSATSFNVSAPPTSAPTSAPTEPESSPADRVVLVWYAMVLLLVLALVW